MSKNKIYSFNIPLEEKYSELLKFLDEEVDNGARSYVIRQILNSYVISKNNTTSTMTLQTIEQSRPETVQTIVSESKEEPEDNYEYPEDLKELAGQFGGE